MKVLGILRGIPASGKSTWIANNELMPYTLCPDDYRIQLGAVTLNEYGKQHISSKYDKVLLASGRILSSNNIYPNKLISSGKSFLLKSFFECAKTKTL